MEFIRKEQGWQEFILSDSEIDALSRDKKLPDTLKLAVNEYLIANDNFGQIIGYYRQDAGKLTELRYRTIENRWMGEIKPRNPQQRCAVDLLQNEGVTVKNLSGLYGSGKSYLMFGQALADVENSRKERIVYIRNLTTVADVPETGFLPGSLTDKTIWTAAPLIDKVGGTEGLNMLINSHKVEPVYLGHIRGRSWENSILYCSEAQNLTTSLVKLIVSRCGEGSEVWFDGDYSQADGHIFNKDSGLVALERSLRGNSLYGSIQLIKTERGSTASLADLIR